MAVKKKQPETGVKRKQRPAITPEARENQMIALAIDKVEERMLNGTASSQEYVHFLKLASSREHLEKEKTKLELELVKAKTENLQSAKRMEEVYEKALDAMRTYGGKKDQ